MRITNNSTAPQGVHAVSGVVYIKPGQTKNVELSEAGLAQAKRLPFLGIEGATVHNLDGTPVKRDSEGLVRGAPATSPLDHDGDGKPGGALPNDPPSERDELKTQAGELGIEYAKNISTEKLKALIDAKLVE